MTIYNFFVMCPEDGFEVFETLDDALDDANEKIKGYLDDGWSEDVTGVCVGKITHRAKMCDQVFRDGEVDEDGIDEAGDYWDPDWDFKCNYKMMPVEEEVMNGKPSIQDFQKFSEAFIATGNKVFKDLEHDQIKEVLEDLLFSYEVIKRGEL